jgi:hypothetical protein
MVLFMVIQLFDRNSYSFLCVVFTLLVLASYMITSVVPTADRSSGGTPSIGTCAAFRRTILQGQLLQDKVTISE